MPETQCKSFILTNLSDLKKGKGLSSIQGMQYSFIYEI